MSLWRFSPALTKIYERLNSEVEGNVDVKVVTLVSDLLWMRVDSMVLRRTKNLIGRELQR